MICSIFGGADIRSYDDIRLSDGVIIAADRGYIHCKRLGISDKIALLIGDFDSIGEAIPENIPVIKAPSEKDDTDMMLAVKKGFEAGCDEFHIYGGLGGRFGHTAANIQTLMYILNRGGRGVLFGDDYDIELLSCGTTIYEDRSTRYVSIFSLTEKAEVIISGLKYSGEVTFTNDFPLGASNEFTEDGKCEITVKSGIIAVVFEKK
ncbi:MAG: thiamine diphosphokinase [Oscillospiraceae bacterium]|nr:thiamine diphosphokinase [Oscillospiraceae bacterium]